MAVDLGEGRDDAVVRNMKMGELPFGFFEPFGDGVEQIPAFGQFAFQVQQRNDIARDIEVTFAVGAVELLPNHG